MRHAGQVAGLSGALDGRRRAQRAGAVAVEPRATTSGSKKSSSADTGELSIWPASISTAARPIASIGCRTVVSGGYVQLMNAESS